MIKGSCLCGACRFETSAKPQGVSMCHCGQCRTQSGGIWSSAYVPRDELHITGPVKWFASSDIAHRGFCPECGSFLFWEAHADSTISFALGSLKTPTGLTLEKHLCVSDKGDYYEINDSARKEG